MLRIGSPAVPARRWRWNSQRCWQRTLAVRLAVFNRHRCRRARRTAWSLRILWAIASVACLTPAAAEQELPAPITEREAAATVLVLGDSLSAGYGFALERGWVHLLRKRLGAEHRVVNASASGDTTTGGLARLGALLEEHRPSIVIIELGGNDGLRGIPAAAIRTNLQAMVEAVQADGARPVLAGMRIHPNYGPRYTEAFHAAYADVAEATGAALVPFLLEGVATDPKLMQRDGIHPNAEAQEKLLENVWEVLAPLVR